uniref:Uncharacterized protein n=1 Tax=Knipowitschia caucasica TaxID=637954 RepID=A0AAV2MMF8_KNICA
MGKLHDGKTKEIAQICRQLYYMLWNRCYLHWLFSPRPRTPGPGLLAPETGLGRDETKTNQECSQFGAADEELAVDCRHSSWQAGGVGGEQSSTITHRDRIEKGTDGRTREDWSLAPTQAAEEVGGESAQCETGDGEDWKEVTRLQTLLGEFVFHI